MHDFILCISDLHAPYGHPDTIPFLKAIKKLYWNRSNNPITVSLGDEVDFHSISFHGADPGLSSPSDELQKAIDHLQPIYDLFPNMMVMESNHGSLVYRKQKYAGLPREVFKSYRDVLEAPKGWKWYPELTLKMDNGQDVYFCHSKGDALKVSQSMGMCHVAGHLHEKFYVQYWANSIALNWSMQIGSLVDDNSLAFAYNSTNMKRPIVGTGVIINGQPMLVPMVLDKKGRWIGEIL
jgi:hypothetical protein